MDKFEALMKKHSPDNDPIANEKKERELILKNAKAIIADAVRRGQSSAPTAMSSGLKVKLPDKKCVICSKDFTPKTSVNVTCSYECREENKRRQKYKNYSKRRGVLKANCIVCNKEYNKRNKILTCSNECRKKRVNDLKMLTWDDKVSSNKKAIKPFIKIIDAYKKKTKLTYQHIALNVLKKGKNVIRDWKCGKYFPTPETQNIIKTLK